MTQKLDVIDASLQLETCLARCEHEYDFEGLSLQQDELELCEQLCHDSFGQAEGDDWFEGCDDD